MSLFDVQYLLVAIAIVAIIVMQLVLFASIRLVNKRIDDLAASIHLPVKTSSRPQPKVKIPEFLS